MQRAYSSISLLISLTGPFLVALLSQYSILFFCLSQSPLEGLLAGRHFDIVWQAVPFFYHTYYERVPVGTETFVRYKRWFALGGGIYCNRHNPGEREYFTNFIANGLDLIQVDDSLRNNGSDSLHNYIARAYNAGLIRRLNMGLFSGETKNMEFILLSVCSIMYDKLIFS
jgi:hypothetical protein